MPAHGSGLHVGLVGLGFGAEFVPIYLHHPDVEQVTICDPDARVLAAVGDRYDVASRTTELDTLLGMASVDAVHLVTPIPMHAEQTVAVLRAGKHCACTVPMATSMRDLAAIVSAQRSSGRSYMMMETAVYTREFLYLQERLRSGAMGRIQLLRGAHYQDMEGWPPYWAGLPPMHYATHAIAPLLALSEARAAHVHCLGSGTMRPELRARYGNPYPIETAVFRLDRGDAALEVTRSLFETARDYTERFDVLGERESFEWAQVDAGDLRQAHVLFGLGNGVDGRGRPVRVARVDAPDRADLLPEPIRRFTRRGVYDATTPHRSFLQGGGHGGSHPHLVHEFVRSIVEGRPPAIDAITAANWTAAGIAAHASAMRDGDRVDVPRFDPQADAPGGSAPA